MRAGQRRIRRRRNVSDRIKPVSTIDLSYRKRSIADPGESYLASSRVRQITGVTWLLLILTGRTSRACSLSITLSAVRSLLTRQRSSTIIPLTKCRSLSLTARGCPSRSAKVVIRTGSRFRVLTRFRRPSPTFSISGPVTNTDGSASYAVVKLSGTRTASLNRRQQQLHFR